jgi:sulfite oxidase
MVLLCAASPGAAAGGSVEPFWGLYQQHQKPEIRDILSKYRIGTLKGAPKTAAATEVGGVGMAGSCS